MTSVVDGEAPTGQNVITENAGARRLGVYRIFSTFN